MSGLLLKVEKCRYFVDHNPPSSKAAEVAGQECGVGDDYDDMVNVGVTEWQLLDRVGDAPAKVFHVAMDAAQRWASPLLVRAFDNPLVQFRKTFLALRDEKRLTLLPRNSLDGPVGLACTSGRFVVVNFHSLGLFCYSMIIQRT